MTLPDRVIAALADRYTIVRELGAGGMATVYLADGFPTGTELSRDGRRLYVKKHDPQGRASI